MTITPPQYEEDFFDVIQGLQEDVATHREKIYRQIEANVIVAWKEVQRIQGQVMAQIARKLPGRLSDVTYTDQRSQ